MFIALAHVCNDVRAAAGCCRGITTKKPVRLRGALLYAVTAALVGAVRIYL